MICQSTQELIPQDMFDSCGNQVKKKTRNLVKKAEGVITDLCERTADTLFSDLESVALAIEGSDLNTTEDHFVPTAKCIQDTKEGQLETRSGLPRLRCCVCHLHHEQAMKSPLCVRQFLKTVLQQVHHFKVDVIAGDANAAAYTYFRKQQYQDLYNSSVAVMLRKRQLEVNTGRPYLKADFILIIKPTITFLNLAQQVILICCFMAILSWRKPPGPSIMRKFWSSSRERIQSKREQTR